MQLFIQRALIIGAGLIASLPLQAQQANPVAIASGGFTSKAIAGYTVDATIGEVVIATVGSAIICTQGVQQPYSAVDYPKTAFTLMGSAKNDHVSLEWTTPAEVNNAVFYVERSADGIVFSIIDSVKTLAPGGNSTSPIAYRYTDLAPFKNSNYYRLRQVSTGGLITYSNTVQVNFVINNWFTHVYPNPVQNDLHIKLYIDKKTMVKFHLYTAAGQQLLIKAKEFDAGYHDEVINMTGFKSGVYILAVRELFTDRRLNVKVLKL